MREQKCIVRNKTQLLAAFGCAWNVPGIITTKIILKRKTGDTIFHITCFDSDDKTHKTKEFRAALAQIRRTPAEAFK